MKIFVTLQLRVTVNSICNSCDVVLTYSKTNIFTMNCCSFKSCIKQSVRSKVGCKMPWVQEDVIGSCVRYQIPVLNFFWSPFQTVIPAKVVQSLIYSNVSVSRQSLFKYKGVWGVWSSFPRLVIEGQGLYREHQWVPLPLHLPWVQVNLKRHGQSWSLPTQDWWQKNRKLRQIWIVGRLWVSGHHCKCATTVVGPPSLSSSSADVLCLLYNGCELNNQLHLKSSSSPFHIKYKNPPIKPHRWERSSTSIHSSPWFLTLAAPSAYSSASHSMRSGILFQLFSTLGIWAQNRGLFSSMHYGLSS